MRRTCLLALLCFAGITSAEAFQGTTVQLQCNIPRGMDLHSTREPSSPVVANVKCGDTLLVIDQRFGSAHLRTEDGKDGYIVEVNMGQYGLQPVSESGAPIAAPATTAQTPTPIRQESLGVGYPRVEVFGGWSFLRPNVPSDILPGAAGEVLDDLGESILGTVMGWGASVTVNLHRNFGITADFSGHYRKFEVSASGESAEASASLHTFLFGPTFTMRYDRVRPFAHALIGFGRVSSSASSSVNIDSFNLSGSVDSTDTGLAGSAGGGIDVIAHPNVAVRAIEFDYYPYRTSDGDSFTFNNFRFRSGVVFGF